jgi:hypothetical protein
MPSTDPQAYPDPIIEKAWEMWYEECHGEKRTRNSKRREAAGK